jgi:hypothetical protein
MNHTLTTRALTVVLLAATLLAIGGCKKEQNNNVTDEIVINLQPGLVHIGTQWVNGQIWVESFDPITNSCLLRQYDARGKMVEGGSKVRLRACRIAPPANQEKSATPAQAPNAAAQNKPVKNKPAQKAQ